jgi:outer membrane protein OmpA-like peptidoglycan-associated protein
MSSTRQFLLTGAAISACLISVFVGVARSEPQMRLAQAAQPEPNQPPPEKRPQQPQRPPAQRPGQTAPAQQQPPAAQGQPAHPPAGAPAQATPPAPAQRPAQTAPAPQPPAAQGQPPHPPGAPAQATPPAPAQRPAQTAPAPQPPAAQGQPPHPPAGAPAQATPPAQQQPAQGQPAQPPAGAPAQATPPAPAQRPAQMAPAQQPAPGAQPQAPAAQTQRPAVAAPLPPPSVAAPTAAAVAPLRPSGNGATAIAPSSAQGQPVLKVEQLRSERHETVEGNRTIIREPDRVIIRENDGRFLIRHSEVERFRYNARDVRVERRGNENVTIVERPDGVRIVTVQSDNGMLLRRSRILPDGREIVIIDQRAPVMASYDYYVELPPPVIRMPRERYIVETERATPVMIYEALVAPPIERLERPYTLEEIRYSPMLRERMPRVDIDTINFEFGSWELSPDQVDRLAGIAEAIGRAVSRNPRETFLIEGHTDAVGSDVDNLSLSDRRAESVALALSERFQVPAENLVTQGYGKQYLKVPTEAPERQNRRVTVRRITPLLAGG